MSLNPNGTKQNYFWNYSHPDRDDYSNELLGTVVFMQEVQAREFSMNGQPGRPRFWPEGNPVMNIRMGFAMGDGSLRTITFQKAGKAAREGKKPSLHMQLYNLSGHNMTDLIGKTLHFTTWPNNPNTGQEWGRGNPRLFNVEEVETTTPYQLKDQLPHEFTVDKLLCDDAVSGGQMVQPQPQQYQPMPQYQQPMPQYQQYQPMPQMHQYQPVQQMPQYQPVVPTQTQPVQQIPQQPVQPVQQVQPQMPEGMDPAIAQAMQAIGAQNVQPYEDEMPW